MGSAAGSDVYKGKVTGLASVVRNGMESTGKSWHVH